jgi:hypothetical protein
METSDLLNGGSILELYNFRVVYSIYIISRDYIPDHCSYTSLKWERWRKTLMPIKNLMTNFNTLVNPFFYWICSPWILFPDFDYPFVIFKLFFTPVLWTVRLPQSLAFCVVFCRSLCLFVFFSFGHCIVCLLWFTSDNRGGNFRLYFINKENIFVSIELSILFIYLF